MEITWKKLISPWTPEEKGDEISGKLLFIEKEAGENKSKLYTLETKDSIRGVWGCVVLDNKMKNFKFGMYVKIVYLGKKEGNNKENYKDFDVYAGNVKSDPV